MRGQSTNRADLREIWATRGIVEETLAAASGGTLGRVDDPLVDATLASDTYRLLAPSSHPAADHLEIGEVIGHGAMGVVRLARQKALRRSVAVKELRADARPGDTAALMREAWIAGQLDHPNVVPIYALYPGERSPMLVMKRIEGTVWSDVILDEAVAARLGVTDPLEWHIEILDKLCRAVHFAHSRGVVHLDLKPDNVMIGAFGEVYLLDWGIAASLRDDAPDWMPRGRDLAAVCGTPAYLSPEQAAGDGPALSERTDVYLLGAILHEIVTGEARHPGSSVRECLFAAWASEPPEYGDDVPTSLATICRRATARDPADRYPDAEAFRQALHAFLTHRASAQLVDAALERLAQLRRAAADDGPPTARVEAALHRLFAECRFGLEQARKTWPDNPDVPEAIQTAVETMIDLALRARRVGEAAALLEDLPRPVPALAERVAVLRRETEAYDARRDALEALQRDGDLNVYRGSRRRLFLLTALAWLGWNVFSGVMFRSGAVPLTHLAVLGGGFVIAALFATLVFLFRRSILATEVNRRTVILASACIVSGLTLQAFAWRFGVDPLHAMAMVFALYLSYVIAFGLMVERRVLLPGLATMAVACLVMLAAPDYTFELHGVAVAVIATASAWFWRRPVES